MSSIPIFDGHNDFAWALRLEYGVGRLPDSIDHLVGNSKGQDWFPFQTDKERILRGNLRAQFWSVWVPCEQLNAFETTMEQIDVVHRLCEVYGDTFKMMLKAEEVERALLQLTSSSNGNCVASLIGIEGGHHLGKTSDFDAICARLRIFYRLGCRYLTLTHTQSTRWCECANAEELDAYRSKRGAYDDVRGLTELGKRVVRAMQEDIGIIVDLSHVSAAAMRDALEVATKPVIFSHSNCRAVFQHFRNVPDDVLMFLKKNQGVCCVVFYTRFIGEEEAGKRLLDHINHIIDLIGDDHVGIGSDFDGCETLAKGIDDVGCLQHLIKLMRDQGFDEQRIEKIAFRNLLRVLRANERYDTK